MSPEPAAAPAVFSAGVDKAIKDTLAAIPPPQRVRVTAGVTTRGAEASLGIRLGRAGEVSGYAGKEWGSGWAAGARWTLTR